MHQGEVYEGSCLTKRRLQTAIFSLSLSLAARCLCPWLLVVSVPGCSLSLSLASCPALLVSVLGFLSGSPCLCPWLLVRLSLSLNLAVCPAPIVSVLWLFVRLSLSLSLAACPIFCRNEALNRSKLLRHTMPDDGRPAVADVPQGWAAGLRKETRRRERMELAAQRRDKRSGGWRKKGSTEGGRQETVAWKDVKRTQTEKE